MQELEFFVGVGMRKELAVLEQAGVGAVLEVPGMPDSEIVINNYLRVKICCDLQDFKNQISTNKQSQAQDSLQSKLRGNETIFLLVVQHSDFIKWLQLLNSVNTGKPINFYFASGLEEIPELLMNIASNLQNQEEFKEFMDNARDELQNKLLRLA